MPSFEIHLTVVYKHAADTDTRTVERTVDAGGNPRFAAWELDRALTALSKEISGQFGDPNDRPANR